MSITPNHFKKIRQRFKTYTDEKKFESIQQRLAMMKADIAYCNLDRKSLEVIKTKLDKCQKIVNRRLKK